MPATLDKLLAELGLLHVDEPLWNAHAAQWSKLTRRWSTAGPQWLQTIAYIDGTADPYWTRAYALSGKVSRVGRVMPCLTRVALNSGAGVPLLIETHAGTPPLKRSLGRMLDRLRTVGGPEAAVDRMTVVDSEAGKAGVLWALHEQHDVFFISVLKGAVLKSAVLKGAVLKGAVLKGAKLRQEGSWQAYRQRDDLCESGVHLFGKDAPEDGVPLRAVQMRRPDSRHPPTPVFTTNASVEDLPTADVASVYLSRWPNQEQSFRDGRKGGGFNRSHGYGREQVTHLALVDKLTKSNASVASAEAAVLAATQTRDQLVVDLVTTPDSTRKLALKFATSQVKRTEKALAQRQVQAAKL